MALNLGDISKLNPEAIAILIAKGELTAESMKSIVSGFLAFFQSLLDLQKIVASPVVKKVIEQVPMHLDNKPITGETLANWHPVGDWIGDDEINKRVNQMAEAVAVDKFQEGFMLAISIIKMIGVAA